MSESYIPLRKSASGQLPTPIITEPKYPSEWISIPTRGWFYPEGHPLSPGEIEIKQMTAREEDLLSNQELIKKGKVLDKLMETLIVNKNIKVDEILTPDKNAIFIAIRRLAYGDEYNVSITCQACGEIHKTSINLNSLQYKPFNFDTCKKGENSFIFTLPSGRFITYKLLSGVDDIGIDAEITNFKKLTKDGTTREWTTRLKYIILSVDGNSDKAFIRKFVDEQLMAKDSLALRKHIRENTPDVDLTFDYTCPNCAIERRLISQWESPFYGLTLTPEDKVRIHKEIFQLTYNSEGSFTHDEVYTMPIYLRYFNLRCLIEQKEKETKQVKRAQDTPKGKKVIQKPF